MNNKQIYQILNTWFPELQHYQLPDRGARTQFDAFIAWLMSPHRCFRPRRYIMYINQQDDPVMLLEHSAVLQDLAVDIKQIQDSIRAKASVIIQYYEKYKHSIGSHCNLTAHIFDNFFHELSIILQRINYQLLFIYGAQQHWLAVPDDQDQIELFCMLFNKQFKDHDQSIENYQAPQMSWGI